MKYFISTIAAIIIFSSCAQTQGPKAKETSLKIPLGIAKRAGAKEAVATFAEGCFWHTEIVFQSLEGVRDAVSGYAGGSDTDPDYEKVSEGNTGHAEAVNVYYNPAIISFETLVKAFFASQDPTQVNGQGNDIGSQYRSIAFYRNAEEKKIIEEQIQQLTDSKKYRSVIATEVKEFKAFYPAEDYHQEYVSKHPDQAYVRNVSIHDFAEFKKNFKAGKFKS
jgi:peptide-methionine (S)-S-oxide reductase